MVICLLERSLKLEAGLDVEGFSILRHVWLIAYFWKVSYVVESFMEMVLVEITFLFFLKSENLSVNSP